MNDSQSIALMFHELKQFCRDISLLLQTGEEIFLRHGWKSAQPDKACVYAGSYSLNGPESWLPRRFFRYYCHSDYPSSLAFLSVVLDLPVGREVEDGTTLLTAGMFRLNAPETWGQWLTGERTQLFIWHTLREDRDDSGRFTSQTKPFALVRDRVDLYPKWNKLSSKIDAVITGGVPLHTVSSASELEDKIIIPLLEVIKDFKHA